MKKTVIVDGVEVAYKLPNTNNRFKLSVELQIRDGLRNGAVAGKLEVMGYTGWWIVKNQNSDGQTNDQQGVHSDLQRANSSN